MILEDQILVNKFGQGLIEIEQLAHKFNSLDLSQKRLFLSDLLFLVMQSNPTDADIEPAIWESKLKPTFTPCVLIKKGVATHNLKKLVQLPENELTKSYILILSLFKIAYHRRYEAESDHPGKWWYWDLSDEEKLKQIREQYPIQK